MKKKLLIVSLVTLAGIAGWLVYRNNRNKKIDETPISYDDAVKNIENL